MKRIAVPEQHLEFMDVQASARGRILPRPPFEYPFGEALLTQPVPLAVIAQNFYGRPSPVDKYKQKT